jgi:alpha-mannosidase
VRVRAWGPFIAEVDVALDTTLPASLAAGRRARSRRRVVTAVRTTIRLAAGSDRVEFTTRVDNRSRDHRLRVLFPAPDARPSDGARAEGHFAVLHRAARPTPAGPDWAEPPGPTAHTAGAIAAGSVAVFGFGLPEYEALEEGAGLTIGLTLLRCVGLLSRDDLTTRPGHAGPGIATPEAQCLGAHTFRYAVRVGEPLGDPELVRASADFRTGWLVGPAGVDPVPALALSGDAVGFSALKRSEDGDAAVLRVFNAGRKPAAVQLDGAFSRAEQSRLDEAAEPGEALADLRAGEIRSIRLTPR